MHMISITCELRKNTKAAQAPLPARGLGGRGVGVDKIESRWVIVDGFFFLFFLSLS